MSPDDRDSLAGYPTNPKTDRLVQRFDETTRTERQRQRVINHSKGGPQGPRKLNWRESVGRGGRPLRSICDSTMETTEKEKEKKEELSVSLSSSRFDSLSLSRKGEGLCVVVISSSSSSSSSSLPLSLS